MCTMLVVKVPPTSSYDAGEDHDKDAVSLLYQSTVDFEEQKVSNKRAAVAFLVL